MQQNGPQNKGGQNDAQSISANLKRLAGRHCTFQGGDADRQRSTAVDRPRSTLAGRAQTKMIITNNFNFRKTQRSYENIASHSRMPPAQRSIRLRFFFSRFIVRRRAACNSKIQILYSILPSSFVKRAKRKAQTPAALEFRSYSRFRSMFFTWATFVLPCLSRCLPFSVVCSFGSDNIAFLSHFGCLDYKSRAIIKPNLFAALVPGPFTARCRGNLCTTIYIVSEIIMRILKCFVRWTTTKTHIFAAVMSAETRILNATSATDHFLFCLRCIDAVSWPFNECSIHIN